MEISESSSLEDTFDDFDDIVFHQDVDDDEDVDYFLKKNKTACPILADEVAVLKQGTSTVGKCEIRKNVCDCSSRGLTSVPHDIPDNITVLHLYNNSITTIKNSTFCQTKKLKFLYLNRNIIKLLEPKAFECLADLVELNLRGNELEYVNGTFPLGIFKPLSSLRVLRIQKNNRCPQIGYHVYPDKALSDLKNVTALYMDGLTGTYFGFGFLGMYSLRNLSLPGYNDGCCRLENINNFTFRNLRKLAFLNISDCYINGYGSHDDAFVPLKNLKVLDLTYNVNIGLQKLQGFLKGIKNYNITKLLINSVVTRFSKSITINSSLVENLPTSLIHLEARENCFESVEDDVFEKLPKNLRYLDVGNNRFIFGKYLINLHKLENLEKLRLTRGGFIYKIPTKYPFQVSSEYDLNMFQSAMRASGSNLIKLRIPPKLKTLDMSVAGLALRLTELEIDEDNTLHDLNLAENYFPRVFGPIKGLNKLTYMNLRHTSVEYIGLNFFKHFPSLQILMLGYNTLEGYFSNHLLNGTIFQDLGNLTYLDLSNSRLGSFPKHTFIGLDKLEVLYLDYNQLWTFDVDISHMKKLKKLNISNNELGSLPNNIREHIDHLKKDLNVSISVDMSKCPIRCDCQHLEFLKWLVSSGAFSPPGLRNYMCQYNAYTRKIITDGYANEIRRLEKECADNVPIFLSVLGSTVAVVFMVITGVVYSFRWKLRYLYYAAVIKLKNSDMTECGHFRYDVFLSYAHQDEEFILKELMPELKQRDLKLHVHGRDFATGNWIAANIVTAVKESRKTLVILTKHLLASKWCNYELQMANMESVDSGRQVLVFLLKESIPSKELGRNLLCHIQNNTYINYPQSSAESDVMFWDKLATDLKR
ncbi:toll-like receptor 4 [Physella acuta]|uniref:toll-like receptor 4 n=1 Tax=Physella acuta TaxID=109671 RepID=UPI0027DC3DE7|nr:toll-like receptor 4 [Physella acuta]